MKKIILFLVMISSVSAFGLERYFEKTISIDSKNYQNFTLNNDNGNVIINSWNDDYIKLTYEIHKNKSFGLKSFFKKNKIDFKKIKIEIINKNNAIIVQPFIPKDIKNYLINFNISIPKSFNFINLNLNNGNSKISNLTGEVEIKNTNGNINIDNLKGNIKVNLTNGHMKIHVIKGNVDLTLNNGSIHADYINGEGIFKVGNGNINIDNTKILKRASLGNGHMKIHVTKSLTTNYYISIGNGKASISIPESEKNKIMKFKNNEKIKFKINNKNSSSNFSKDKKKITNFPHQEFMDAIIANNQNKVKKLISEKEFDPNYIFNNSFVYFDNIFIFENLEMAKILFDAGTDIDLMTSTGQTIAERIEISDNNEMKKLLRKYKKRD